MFTFQQYDQNDEFLAIVAAGNAGDDGGLDVPKTVESPASSKNGIGVGATVSWGSSLPNRGYGPSFVTYFSSRGPTADGRMKPDLMAPGNKMLSAGARPNEQGECDSDLKYSAGTSMAAPVVSGTAAKIRQYFRQGYYPSGEKNSDDAYPNPSGGLLKAVLLNGAQALLGVDNVIRGGGVTPSAPYDNNQGFGRLSLQDSVYLAGKTNVQLKIWDRESVPNGGTNTYDVTIDKSGGCQSKDLSVTLVWMEEGSPSGCTACVLHDLDLSVSFRGKTYYPNGRSSPDRTNNSERVVINGVQDGETATISVNAHNIAKSDQTYALVATACFNGVANTLVGENVFGLQSAAPSTSLSPSDSSMPSASPSTSDEPSDSPSESAQPSSQPSLTPSESAQPSSMPSLVPSESSQPSSMPSLVPSESSQPSSMPSVSVAPSVSAQPSSSSMPSFTRATKIMNLLLSADVLSEGALDNEDSPQGKAFLWVTTSPLQLQPGDNDAQIIQQYILAVFYYATNGAGWKDNNGWLGSETECNWFRVDCIGGVVTKLKPYGNNLVGSIPSEVGSLDSLGKCYPMSCSFDFDIDIH